MLLSAPGARAGHWSLAASGSCTGTTNGQPATSPPWGPPQGPFTNSISFSSYSVGAGGYGYPQYHTVGTGSVQINITATVTGSWVADGTSDETAPPSVVLQETSGAYYKASYGSGSGSGTASDGLSNPTDAVVSPYDTSYDASGSSSSVAAHYVKKSGSSWTESFTITASANASNPDGFAKAEVGFSGLTVSTHAQPYNMRRTPNPDGTPNPSGELTAYRLIIARNAHPILPITPDNLLWKWTFLADGRRRLELREIVGPILQAEPAYPRADRAGADQRHPPPRGRDGADLLGEVVDPGQVQAAVGRGQDAGADLHHPGLGGVDDFSADQIHGHRSRPGVAADREG